LFPIFNFANAKVINDFKEYQRNNSLPEDEQLNSVILNDITVINTSVYLDVQLFPVAQPPITFLLPIPV
jgi:hypothetical protein